MEISSPSFVRKGCQSETLWHMIRTRYTNRAARGLLAGLLVVSHQKCVALSGLYELGLNSCGRRVKTQNEKERKETGSKAFGPANKVEAGAIFFCSQCMH